MGHPIKEKLDGLELLSIDLSGACLQSPPGSDAHLPTVIKTGLPALAREWSRSFVQIYIDGSSNPIPNKTKKPANMNGEKGFRCESFRQSFMITNFVIYLQINANRDDPSFRVETETQRPPALSVIGLCRSPNV